MPNVNQEMLARPRRSMDHTLNRYHRPLVLVVVLVVVVALVLVLVALVLVLVELADHLALADHLVAMEWAAALLLWALHHPLLDSPPHLDTPPRLDTPLLLWILLPPPLARLLDILPTICLTLPLRLICLVHLMVTMLPHLLIIALQLLLLLLMVLLLLLLVVEVVVMLDSILPGARLLHRRLPLLLHSLFPTQEETS